MKQQIIIIGLLCLSFISCKKEYTRQDDSSRYLGNVKSYLKDSMGNTDFQDLDFTKSVRSNVDSINSTLTRIPFKQRSITTDFVLVQTTQDGTCLNGKIVHVEGNIVTEKNYASFNGSIRLQTLKRQAVLESDITNGRIDVFLQERVMQRSSAMLEPDRYTTLPEVVVVGYKSSTSGGVSWSTWISLNSFLNVNDGGSSGGYYNSLDPNSGGSYGGGGSGGGGGYTGGGIRSDPPILIDYEYGYYQAAIDLNKYLKCFSNISDAGATCSIELFADLPVDNDPNNFFAWENGSPGHTFIQLKKSNGTQVAQQSFGFYPVSGWKTTLTPAPINGKFVDNGGHEFNASIKMDLTPGQLQNIIIRMQYLSRFIKYDIDEYNCTDWALELFNHVRSDQIKIPMYDLPGAQAPFGTSTPQGLYQKLQSMKQTATAEAKKITIGIVKGWVGGSNGPCN